MHPGNRILWLYYDGPRQINTLSISFFIISPFSFAVYFWQDESSVEMNPDVSLAEFYVVGYKQRRVLEVLTSGNYSRLCMDIMFTRSMGYYLIQVGSI